MRLVNWRALVVGAVGFGLAACGDDVTVVTPPPNITLNPTALNCVTGETRAVGVTVTGGSNTSVAFAAGGSGITVTANGSSGATVVCGNTPGAAVINVTVTSGGQTYNSAIPVTISQNPATGQASVVAIALQPSSASLTPGGTVTITPTVTLANGAPATTSTDVTYTSSNAAVTVTRNANNTATVQVAANAAAGTQAVITATPNANTNLRAFTTITVVGTNTLVTGLSVSPTSIALNVGGTQAIVSNVQLAAGAPAGTSTNVTCTSSNTSVVTVTSTPAANCTVTAVANGTATITVASQAAPNVQQLVGVTVSSPAPVRLTIQDVQIQNGAGQQVSVGPGGNVAGQIFVVMNLDPGDNRPDSVVVTIGGQRVNCQRFSAQLVEAYRAAMISGAADVQPITCPINTSQFNSTSGAPLVLNGTQPLTATVFFRTGATGTGSSTSQSATITQNLTVNNQSGFFVQVTNTPSATQTANGAPTNGQATGPQGVVWRAGTINVTVLPVSFAGGGAGSPTFAGTTVSLVDCPAIVGGVCAGQRLVATRTTTQAAGSLAGTVSFTGDTGCFWDASFATFIGNQVASGAAAAGFANLNNLFTNSGVSACTSMIASGVSTGFTGDPTTATLEGYTTPNAGRTTTGASNVPANTAAATYVVIGSTTATFGVAQQAGNVILGANGQPVGLGNQPANSTQALGGNIADAIYIDNQAPEPVAQTNFPTTNFSTSVDPATGTANLVAGFFNANQTFTPAAFQFSYFDPTTGAQVATNPDFGGVDRVSDQFFAAPLSGAASNVTTGSPNTFVGSAATRNVTTGNASGLASLPNNNFYRLAVSETDALGNRRNAFVQQIFNPGGASATIVATRFNVDIAAPVLALVAAQNAANGAFRVSSTSQVFGPRAIRNGFQTVTNVAVNPELAFTYSDDIGFGPTPLQITLARYRRAGTTATVECFGGVDATGLAIFNDISSGAAGSNGASCVPVLTSGNAIRIPNTGAAASAVYTGTAQARDQAGNLSAAIPFQFVVDLAAPSTISLSLPQTLAGNTAVTFTAGATDNLAVASGAPRVNYAAAALPTPNGFVPANVPAGTTPQSLIYPENRVLNLATVFASLLPNGNSSFAALPQSQSAMTLTIPNFIRTITPTGATTGVPSAAGYATAQSLQAEIFDLANNVAVSTALPIPAANIPNVPAASPYISATNQVNNINSFYLNVVAGSPTIPPTPQGVQAAICGPVTVSNGCPSNATFVVTQTGAGSTYISQLTRIELWVYDPISNGYRFLATAPAGFVTDAAGAPRVITSTVTLPANTQPYFLAPTTGTNVYEVLALGINAGGDAISSNLVLVSIAP